MFTKDHLPTAHYEFQQFAYWLARMWLKLTANLITSFFICTLPEYFFSLKMQILLFRGFVTLVFGALMASGSSLVITPVEANHRSTPSPWKEQGRIWCFKESDVLEHALRFKIYVLSEFGISRCV